MAVVFVTISLIVCPLTKIAPAVSVPDAPP